MDVGHEIVMPIVTETKFVIDGCSNGRLNNLGCELGIKPVQVFKQKGRGWLDH